MVVIKKKTKLFILVLIYPKNVDKNLKHEIEFIIKCNESLAEHKNKKMRLINYSQNIRMETIKQVKPVNHTNLFLTCHKDTLDDFCSFCKIKINKNLYIIATKIFLKQKK